MHHDYAAFCGEGKWLAVIIGLFAWHLWPGLDLVGWDAAEPDVAPSAQQPVDPLSYREQPSEATAEQPPSESIRSEQTLDPGCWVPMS